MRTRLIALLLALCFLPGLAGQKGIPDSLPPVDFDQDTLSLPPAYFPELPPQIAAWLELRKYRIPQMNPADTEYKIEGIHNVIYGNFDGTDKDDWAAIVFRTDTIKAFVFFNSDTTNIEQVNIIDQDQFDTEETMKTIKIHKWYDTFHILLCRVDKEKLNNVPATNFENISEEVLSEIKPFTHDGFKVHEDGDMVFPAPARYYHSNKWILFEFYKFD